VTRPARAAFCVVALLAYGCHHARPHAIATIDEVIASKTDLWGEAALREPGGPSYAFFDKLLPPLRYVDADFRCYPIVLSAPAAPVKGRLVSNGSAINALARQPNWKNEAGMPVHVLVGRSREMFGADLGRLDGPRYVDGYLPIVQLAYTQDGDRYGQEVLASVDPQLAANGTVLAKFTFPVTKRGRIELRFETGNEFCSGDGSVITDPAGNVLAVYDENWEFNAFRSSLTSKPDHAPEAVVMIFTRPVPAMKPTTGFSTGVVEEEAINKTAASARTSSPAFRVDLATFQQQREAAAKTWNELLATGTTLDVPEPVVNNAWRSLLIGTTMIRSGDQLNYSASNQYARQYANESGDSMRSLLLWGHTDAARRSIKPLFVYKRPASVIHDAAFKLELLADYFFVTRDRTLIDETRPLWQHEVDLLLKSRQADGLLPRERYCSDIPTPVYSLNNNANAWRGLRDMSLVLRETGDAAQAESLAATAKTYREVILAAMEKTIDRTVDPPFIPVAMGGEESAPDPITGTRLGSYWNLVVPCILWSGLFPIDSSPASDIIRYIQTRGGLCMGMTRVQSNPGVWTNVQNIDDLYTIRYALALLKRDDDPDRSLVSFYGKLAQGMTRDTFIDGESTGIVPLDRFGRQIALPPNSTANASFLMQLRYLLVQDWDTDDDGSADTLRLLFATPRKWLEDGNTITVRRAPTMFGETSLTVRSRLKDGEVIADLKLPNRTAPSNTLLRLRLPDGWHITSASTSDQSLSVDRETIDVSQLRGDVTVRATVARGRR
jgi:hypothetical protein